MHVSLVGINHQTSPISVREKVAVGSGQLDHSLSLLRACIPYGIILSTCNRTEVYTTDRDGGNAWEASLSFLKTQTNIDEVNLRQCTYTSQDEDAIEHLFRVSAGLESMVVGEFEVLGQIGHALEMAEAAGMVNLPLRHIFQGAIRSGRRVRSETEISKNALSVSSVAVDLASKIVGDLSKCKILVVGTGEAGSLVLKVARERGASHIVVASRTRERAEVLANRVGGIPTSASNLGEAVSKADIVVTCTGAPRFILNEPQVRAAMKQRQQLPLVIIDIAVPREVEPAVGQIENVFLYNIDNLTEIATVNRKQRQGETEQATEIVRTEVAKLTAWWRLLEVRPVVSALMSKAEEIRQAQLEKTLKKLPPLSGEERENLEAMTKAIVTKILKEPIQYLKDKGDGQYAEAVRELFQLEGEE